MKSLEDELQSTLREIDQLSVADPGLERRVVAGIRKRRRATTALATLGATTVVATAAAVALLVTGGNPDETASSPAASGKPGTDDCTGMRPDATGVSSGRSADGTRELVLTLRNTAPGETACTIDARIRVSLTAGSVSVTSTEYDAPPVDIPGQTSGDAAAAIFLTWGNWCADGPVTAIVEFPDGTSVARDLARPTETPRCTDPDAPAALTITRAAKTDVMEASPAGSSRDSAEGASEGIVLLTGTSVEDALIRGRLSLLGNCAAIGDSVAIWPKGTRIVTESPVVLDIPGLGEVQEGDRLVGGGGFFDAATDDVTVDIPDSCGTTYGVSFRVE